MKKVLVSIALVALLAGFAFANGNAEQLSTIDGTVSVTTDPAGQVQLLLRTRNGDELAIDAPQAEMQQLQARFQAQNRIQVRVSGIVVDPPRGEQARTRLVLRTMAANGEEYQVQDPIQLTQQERARIRLYQDDGSATQTRTQTQTQTGTRGSAGASATQSKK